MDLKTTGDLIDFQLEKGTPAFFVNGLGVEVYSVTFEERIQILDEVIKRCEGTDAKIMSCIYVTSVAEGKKLMDMHKGRKFDAYCFTAPPFFEYTDEALYSFTADLLKYTDKPCYIYNCREMGTLYSPELLGQLAKDFPNLRGYKDATRNTVHLLNTMMYIEPRDPDFDFLCGCDGSTFGDMAMGCVGAVSFMGVPFPEQMNAVINAGLAGDWKKCKEEHQKILKLRLVMKKAPNSAAYIYAENFTGGPVAKNTRQALEMNDVDEDVKEELKKVIEEIGAMRV